MFHNDGGFQPSGNPANINLRDKNPKMSAPPHVGQNMDHLSGIAQQQLRSSSERYDIPVHGSYNYELSSYNPNLGTFSTYQNRRLPDVYDPNNARYPDLNWQTTLATHMHSAPFQNIPHFLPPYEPRFSSQSKNISFPNSGLPERPLENFMYNKNKDNFSHFNQTFQPQKPYKEDISKQRNLENTVKLLENMIANSSSRQREILSINETQEGFQHSTFRDKPVLSHLPGDHTVQNLHSQPLVGTERNIEVDRYHSQQQINERIMNLNKFENNSFTKRFDVDQRHTTSSKNNDSYEKQLYENQETLRKDEKSMHQALLNEEQKQLHTNEALFNQKPIKKAQDFYKFQDPSYKNIVPLQKDQQSHDKFFNASPKDDTLQNPLDLHQKFHDLPHKYIDPHREFRKSPHAFQKPPQEFQKPPQGFQKPDQEFQKPHQKLQNSTQEVQQSSQEFPKLSQEFQKQSQEFPKLSQEFYKLPQEFQKSPQEFQEPSQEFRDPPQEFKKSTQVFQKPDQEFQKPHQKLPNSTQEVPKSSQEFQKQSQEFPKQSQEFHKLPKEFQKSPQEFQEPSQEFQKPPQDFQKSPHEFQNLPQEIQKSPPKFQKMDQEFQKTNQELQNSPQEIQKSPQEFQKANKDQDQDSLNKNQEPYDGPQELSQTLQESLSKELPHSHENLLSTETTNEVITMNEAKRNENEVTENENNETIDCLPTEQDESKISSDEQDYMSEDDETLNITEQLPLPEAELQIEVDKDKKIEIPIIEDDIDSKNHDQEDFAAIFLRDTNKISRKEIKKGKIVDHINSVEEATAAMRDGPSSKYYECQHCKYYFRHPKRFLIHFKWHSFGLAKEKRKEIAKQQETVEKQQTNDAKTQQCNVCAKYFINLNSLKKHKRRFHPSDQLECPQCGVTVAGQVALREHKKAEHPDDSVCPQCQRKCSSKYTLRKHMRTHLEKHISCSQCDKQYATEVQLRDHMRVHERIARGAIYKCQYCEKSFYQPYNLQAHERTHNKEKLFECEICRTKFATNSSLQRHIKVSHNAEKPLSCTECNRCFAEQRTLVCHMSKVHPECGVVGVKAAKKLMAQSRPRKRSSRKGKRNKNDDTSDSDMNDEST